jgi:hypothetical protein
MIPASDRAKTVHALDLSATVIGKEKFSYMKLGYCARQSYRHPLIHLGTAWSAWFRLSQVKLG